MRHLFFILFLLVHLPLYVYAGEFEERCADPNVVRCYDFDNFVDITTGNPQNTTPYEAASRMQAPSGGLGNCTLQNGTACWDLDPNTKVNGASALRFQVPTQSGSDTSGSFHMNFADDYSQRFGEGEEFYVQFRYRLSSEMIRIFDGGGGVKVIIVGNGDWAGGPAQHSCTILESVITTNNNFLGPVWYHSCGNFVGLDRWESATCNQVRITDIVNESEPRYCCYTRETGGYPNGCWQWTANEWLTVQMNIKVGQWNVPGTSRVRVWVAREGETSVLHTDSDVGGSNTSFAGKIFNDDTANFKYGKLWLTPYNYGKDSSASHPTAYVWYDNLIVSRTRIPDPGAVPADHQAPAAPSSLKVQ